jgi:protein-S-isoprenylcysteine O-methyltransferase Ste14
MINLKLKINVEINTQKTIAMLVNVLWKFIRHPFLFGYILIVFIIPKRGPLSINAFLTLRNTIIVTNCQLLFG